MLSSSLMKPFTKKSFIIYIGLVASLLFITFTTSPLQNVFVTVCFFILLCALLYLTLRALWALSRRPFNAFHTRLLLVVAVELTILLMLNSASQVHFSDLLVLSLIGLGSVAYIRWRFYA